MYKVDEILLANLSPKLLIKQPLQKVKAIGIPSEILNGII